MNFIADLHVHSKYSIATAKNLDLEHMYVAAQMKGITVVGTGDFTHPAWFDEIATKLQPAEQGLFKLKEDIAAQFDSEVPAACRRAVRFMLVSEISNIYKKDNKTRKNHNLIFMPNRREAKAFNSRLDRIGNIKADGRPILGLDARNLLEIMLEISDGAFLVPAHIWTPWFSVLGSKSGFDSIEACYEDLTKYIFAVETGLSSDPAMNWRISELDRMTLISNSDAHSPLKLGREANRFNCDLSFQGIKTALETGNPDQFLGTYEYYPEEGKYHLDGHRKCGVRLWPNKTIDHKGICPVCSKPLTLGVLYRVEELADRPPGIKPPKHHPFASMLPLTDILSELLQKGPQTKTVQKAYQNLLNRFGAEFDILHNHDPDILQTSELPLLGEAVRRMRNKTIQVKPGFDGEFGKIKIFEKGEQERLCGQKTLFSVSASKPPPKKIKKLVFKSRAKINRSRPKPTRPAKPPANDLIADLNTSQRKVVRHDKGPLLVVAGPGTGKTRTLTHRIAYLIKQKGISAQQILAVTFTHKAAQEMQDRLEGLLGTSQELPQATTFHSFCLKLLRSAEDQTIKMIIDDVEQDHLVQEARQLLSEQEGFVSLPTRKIKRKIMGLKQQLVGPDDSLEAYVNKQELGMITGLYRLYQQLLERYNRWDFEDLIFKSVRLLDSNKDVRAAHQNAYQYVFIDEYQDLNEGQYRLIRALVPEDRELCAIGDPNQAIYGFRGSDVRYFNRFKTDYPKATLIHLTRNYRSTQTILEASNQVIRTDRSGPDTLKTFSKIDGVRTIHILTSATATAEAVAVGKIIESLVGGTGFHSIDFGKTDGSAEALSFSDFGVLYRTRKQADIIGPVFEKAGIPFQVANRQTHYNEGVPGALLALLRVVLDRGSFLDGQNIAKWLGAGIGAKTWQRLSTWAHANKYDLGQALFQARRLPIPDMRGEQQTKINTFSGYLQQLQTEVRALRGADRLRHLVASTNLIKQPKQETDLEDALQSLYALAERFGSHTELMLAHLALQSDTDLYNPQAEKVALMTLHAAKGLEFPVVFIVGCEDDYIPHRRSPADKTALDEERRLFYVAMTRAKEQLFLSWAQHRQIYGKKTKRTPSPFVQDIEARLMAHVASKPHKPRPPEQRQLQLF